MPKRRRTTAKILKRTHPATIKREMLHKQLTCVQRDKENNLNSMPESTNNDSVLTFMKIEVKEEEINENDQLDFSQEINIPLKIEQFETLDNNSIKKEELVENENESMLAGTSNQDLNILIEWALNLQFDHSRKCNGRLYPCKEIFDNFSCKIVVLYCTVCKKRMLHTLKDWAML